MQEEYYDENNGSTNNTDILGGMDFDVNDEYKPDPIVPQGAYHGVVSDTRLDAARYCIVWDVTLHDNGGMLSDNETPVDGARVQYKNWLPKPGDESTLTASGRATKRQSKINMMKDFQTAMDIDMSRPEVIAEALNDKLWVGLEVDVVVVVEEWQGKFRSTINRMAKSKSF